MKRRSLWFLPLIAVYLLCTLPLSLTGCPPTEQPESTPEAGPAEITPEKVVEPEPEQVVGRPPVGVGEDCQSGPRGNDCNTTESKMLCLPVDGARSICYENCTDDTTCQDPKEQCISVNAAGQRACYIIGEKGDTCGVAVRTRCKQDLADPPVFCIGGTCTERPADGWDVGQRCRVPRGDEQSDCKDGLSCIELSADNWRCLKKCTADAECPNGEVCWDQPLGKSVCLIGSKEGGPCNRNERQFCKSDDPQNFPLTCRNDVCVSTVTYVALGEKCKKDIDPTNKQGDCEPGLHCLGVSEFESRCHKPCTATSDCPNGEACVDHPDLPSPATSKACVIPIQKDGACNLLERKYCFSGTGQFLRCDRPDGSDAGTCIEINVGDGCVNDDVCGPLICVPLSMVNLYCLVPCNPMQPQCPGNGICRAFGDMGMPPFACVPNGPKKVDEACKPLAAGEVNLDTTQYCEGNLSCVVGSQMSPTGVCTPTVAGCAAGACDIDMVKRVCLPLGNIGACPKDCSAGSMQTCTGGTTCTEVQGGARICL